MKRYTVWMEGYVATGNEAKAQFVGTIRAASFPEACQKLIDRKKWDRSYYRASDNSYWACGFFDNEQDARKSFG